MSGQREQLSTAQTRFDPISCVGVILLLWGLFMGMRSIIDTLAIRPIPTPTALILSVAAVTAHPTTPTPTQTRITTPWPTIEQATVISKTVEVIRVTATPSPTPTATNTLQPTTTNTPQPTATPTHSPTETPFIAFVRPITEKPDELNSDLLTVVPPTPTPLPTPDGPDNGAGLPILMYHYTSEPPEGANIYRVDLSVSPQNLRRQLEYLQAHGYTTIDFYDLARGLANRQTLPEKPVILTFDDGYRDNYEQAFPLLQAFGMKGVFFLVTESINFRDERYMTWEMVREMSDAGMSMEIHTVSHPNLADQSYEKARDQILTAQEEIAAVIGKTPRFLSYPGGDYDEETIQIVRELDLWGAVTTQYGTFHRRANRYEWKRVRMRYTTTINEFAALLKAYAPTE